MMLAARNAGGESIMINLIIIKIRYVSSKMMRLMDHISDHVLDHMIIGFITTAVH